MARAKRSSTILETARQRLAGLKQITPAPDFGPSLKQSDYEGEITGYSTDQDSYNGDVAALDDKQNRLDKRELGLRDWNRRILSAVGAQYGTDSSEYELVGGTRTSERKKPTRKTPTSGAPTT
jgi:hypothetical protein